MRTPALGLLVLALSCLHAVPASAAKDRAPSVKVLKLTYRYHNFFGSNTPEGTWNSRKRTYQYDAAGKVTGHVEVTKFSDVPHVVKTERYGARPNDRHITTTYANGASMVEEVTHRDGLTVLKATVRPVNQRAFEWVHTMSADGKIDKLQARTIK